MLLSAALIILAYLSGSLCSAIIVCRIFSLPDPRQEGSGNPGATNVLRIAGKHYAFLVLVGDMLKGTLPVVLAKILGATPSLQAFVVLATVLGHMYPIFFRFQGGKGVATALGALLGLHLILGVIVVTTWLVVAKMSKYSSLASLVAVILSPIFSLMLFHDLNLFPPLFFMVILVVYKHKGNITRLMDGNEPKIKFKLKKSVLEEVMTPPAPPEVVEPPAAVKKKPVKKKPKAKPPEEV